MGLTTKQAQAKFDEIIAFGELEGFVDQKLKNYSSGMQVRLAFSVMVHTDADVMVIDEVLAVGDAAPSSRSASMSSTGCAAKGRRIVLGHPCDGAGGALFCHRAMMIAGGHITRIGSPAEVGREYLSENFRTLKSDVHDQPLGEGVRLVDAWVSDADGNRRCAMPCSFGETMQLPTWRSRALRPITEAGGSRSWLRPTRSRSTRFLVRRSRGGRGSR